MQIVNQTKPNHLPEKFILTVLHDLSKAPRPLQEFHSTITNELLRQKLIHIRRGPSPYRVDDKTRHIKLIMLSPKGHKKVEFEQQKQELVTKYKKPKTRDGLSKQNR